MDYNASWQSVIAAASSRGETSFCRFTHYTHIASYCPTLRSVWWRILLGVLPRDHNNWLSTLRKQRQEYEELRKKLSVTPANEDNEDLSLNNPLSQDTQSSWNQYFEDSKLKKLIRQDVERTFPEERYFHTPLVQETLVVILFCFAREHPDINFKQGLHEILAPLLLVFRNDYEDYEKARNNTPSPIVQEVMDATYMEHDAYYLFCGIMKRIGKWFLSREDPPPPISLQKRIQHSLHLQELLHAQPFAAESAAFSPLTSPGDLSPLLERINHIHTRVLPIIMPELSEHINALDIPPQVYCIRWLRLLFGREVSLPQLLVVWDALFWCCNEEDLPLVDHISVALLGSVEYQLLNGDYLCCLKTLMTFPVPEDINHILSVALHIHTNASSARKMSTISAAAAMRSRNNSADELESDSFLNSSNSTPPYSSLPPLPVAHHARPNTLPDLHASIVNTPQSKINFNNASRNTVQGNIPRLQNSVIHNQRKERVSSSQSMSSSSGSNGQRVQSANSAVQFRSRSQVTRCVSEGEPITTRHPSMSPRRPVTSKLYVQKDLTETESTHKSNLLNFVKFSTVKFSKAKEGTNIEPTRVSSSPKQLQDLSTTKLKSSNGKQTINYVDQDNLGEVLQKLAGEFTGHLFVLNDKHKQLKLENDLSIKVTMDRLLQVSDSLQKVADKLSVNNNDNEGVSKSREGRPRVSDSLPKTPQSASLPKLSRPLQHPLMVTPD